VLGEQPPPREQQAADGRPEKAGLSVEDTLKAGALPKHPPSRLLCGRCRRVDGELVPGASIACLSIV
jgi:hypothetical protein